MTKHPWRTGALALVVAAGLALAFWAHGGIGSVWMLQSLSLCG